MGGGDNRRHESHRHGPLMSNVVLIATTGAPSLRRAVESVLAQSMPTACYVVCDGEQFRAPVAEVLHGLDVPVCVLPRNVGADGFYGHRIYAAFAHLVDEDHVLFLDQDNFLAPDHVARCVDLIAARRLQWCYSLRNICTPRASSSAATTARAWASGPRSPRPT
jgi:Glycosyl transferase family 2